MFSMAGIIAGTLAAGTARVGIGAAIPREAALCKAFCAIEAVADSPAAIVRSNTFGPGNLMQQRLGAG